MSIKRILKHLLIPTWWVQRAFPKAVIDQLEQEITASEEHHRGELRLIIEGPLPLHWLKPGPRDRARYLFATSGAWDTAENSGILIYIQIVDRRVEIVADRGISARVAPQQWRSICSTMEQAFRAHEWHQGCSSAIKTATHLLYQHFPAENNNPNELKNRPSVI